MEATFSTNDCNTVGLCESPVSLTPVFLWIITGKSSQDTSHLQKTVPSHSDSEITISSDHILYISSWPIVTDQKVVRTLTVRKSQNREQDQDKYPVNSKIDPNLLASPSGREVAFTVPPSGRTGNWLQEATERQAFSILTKGNW